MSIQLQHSTISHILLRIIFYNLHMIFLKEFHMGILRQIVLCLRQQYGVVCYYTLVQCHYVNENSYCQFSKAFNHVSLGIPQPTMPHPHTLCHTHYCT